MTDRPIIFSGPMVRALLDGRKTQTRRLLSPQPETFLIAGMECEVAAVHVDAEAVPRVATGRVLTRQKLRCAVGDSLYVREAWHVRGRYTDVVEVGYSASQKRSHTEYVEQFPVAAAVPGKGKWPTFPKSGPSIHMPRWASRLTLTVEDVRVERLQAISEADAVAEGVRRIGAEFGAGTKSTSFDDGPNLWTVDLDGYAINAPTPVETFRLLWESLHGAESWASNPFVVALTFRVERGNIDRSDG